jgi:hypothetical protein
MKKALLGLVLAAATAVPAQAAVLIGVTPGTSPYSGPTGDFFFDFESPTARWDRSTFTGTTGNVRAQPFGSTGQYASVGPADGTPGTFNLTGLGPIRQVSFIWGSVDSYNTLEVLGAGGAVLASITGNQIFNPASGNRTDPNTNPVVTLTFTGVEYGQVTALRFNSTQNAFEFDNLSVAVPEPSTWAMMIGGFGLLGAAARRSRKARAVYA